MTSACFTAKLIVSRFTSIGLTLHSILILNDTFCSFITSSYLPITSFTVRVVVSIASKFYAVDKAELSTDPVKLNLLQLVDAGVVVKYFLAASQSMLVTVLGVKGAKSVSTCVVTSGTWDI